jgi:hypothetical protein
VSGRYGSLRGAGQQVVTGRGSGRRGRGEAVQEGQQQAGRALRRLDLRDVADAVQQVHRPARLQVGQQPGAAGGDQPVLAALQHDAGDPDGRDERAVAGRPGHQQRERAGRLEERRVGVRVEAALAGHLHRELADLGRHARRVGAGQLQGGLHEGLGAQPGPRRASDRSATPGHGEQRHLPGQRPARPGAARQGRPDQGQPGDRGGVGRRVQHRQGAAHRVAHQHRRAVVHLREEPAEQLAVGRDGRRAPGPRRAAVPGQVDGHDAVLAGQQGGQVVPVGVRAAEAVHRDHQLTVGGAAVVHPADRAVEVSRADVGSAGRRGREVHERAPSSRPGTVAWFLGSCMIRARPSTTRT